MFPISLYTCKALDTAVAVIVVVVMIVVLGTRERVQCCDGICGSGGGASGDLENV